ncbi:MAG: hypothetical protein M3178_05885, partial [Pseudomonadota bacterium]|nr:hypothetical protein [Pseudomonadota bacterium]
ARKGEDGHHRSMFRRTSATSRFARAARFSARAGTPQVLDAVIARLAPLPPEAVAVEAAGGFETVVAASLAARGCRLAW